MSGRLRGHPLAVMKQEQKIDKFWTTPQFGNCSILRDYIYPSLYHNINLTLGYGSVSRYQMSAITPNVRVSKLLFVLFRHCIRKSQTPEFGNF